MHMLPPLHVIVSAHHLHGTLHHVHVDMAMHDDSSVAALQPATRRVEESKGGIQQSAGGILEPAIPLPQTLNPTKSLQSPNPKP